MKRLLLLSLLILALLTPAVLAEEAEPAWKNEELIWVMPEEYAVAVPAANAAAGTVSLTASKTTALVSEMVTLTISAPGASAVRLYDYYGENNWNLWQERNDSTLSMTYAANEARTDRYFATACFDGEWTAEPGELISITFTAEGSLETPAYNMPSRANAGEAFKVTVSEVPHATEYSVSIYRINNGSYQSAGSIRQENAGEFEFTIYDPGEYNVSISAYGLGWNSATARTEIIIAGDDSPVPTVTLLSDPEGIYYLGGIVRVHVELEGATEFISHQGSNNNYDESFPAVNGSADIEVRICSIPSGKSAIRFRAIVDGKSTGLSDMIAVSTRTLAAPTLTFDSTVEQGDMLTITVGGLHEHFERANIEIIDAQNKYVFGKTITDAANPVLTIDSWMLDVGEYIVRAYQYIPETTTGSYRAEMPLTVTANSNPPEVGTILFRVSNETLYTGTQLTVFAYAPGAKAVRICDGTEANECNIETGERASWSIRYNSAYTLNLFAQATYDGTNWSVTTETKQVEFISRGRLEAPTFDCKTEFAVGEPIVITRTNTVENAETYLAFLSKADHTDSQNINFNGANTVSFDGINEPGNYIVSVLAMAPGWSNNQTNLNIIVTDGVTPVRQPITITFSGNGLNGDEIPATETLTITAYAPGADRVRICEGNETHTYEDMVADGDICVFKVVPTGAYNQQFFAEAIYGDSEWTNRSEYKFIRFVGQGTLEDPPISCKETFAVGEDITVTVTAHVENAEYYYAILADGNEANYMAQGRMVDDSYTFSGLTEPGEYTVIVLSEAQNWNHGRSVLHFTVVDGTPAGDHHCGENVTWSLSDDGTLTISGTGKMFSYYSEATPWGYDIKKVIVEPGVTVVGGCAFMNCYNLKSVQLPAGLKRIGQRAFSYCYNMEEVNLPDSLESIGACAFMGCEQLIEVVIPAGIENIGFGTFQSCVNIKKVSLPSTLTRIGKYAFANCLSLDALIIPESVTDIDNYAFAGGHDLKTIRLPDTLSHIGEDIFGGRDVAVFCNSASATSQWAKGQGLTVFPLDKNIIVLPEDIKTVESEAFAGLSEPTTVVIPDTVEYIARDAFSGSTVAIRANDGTEGADYAYQLDLPRFPH